MKTKVLICFNNYLMEHLRKRNRIYCPYYFYRTTCLSLWIFRKNGQSVLNFSTKQHREHAGSLYVIFITNSIRLLLVKTVKTHLSHVIVMHNLIWEILATFHLVALSACLVVWNPKVTQESKWKSISLSSEVKSIQVSFENRISDPNVIWGLLKFYPSITSLPRKGKSKYSDW